MFLKTNLLNKSINILYLLLKLCSVLECNGLKINPTVSLFKVPIYNCLAWNEAIRKANNQKTVVKCVFADHFSPCDLVTSYSVPQDIIEVCLFLKILIRIRGKLILKRNLYLKGCWSKTESH